ncbi:MAG: glycosyltransferase family 4 protein [Anaerolineae bacterium]|nr:glycosyltransferase family 4 protein [Gloeobacterales cyanobacterium ES-bin-313]
MFNKFVSLTQMYNQLQLDAATAHSDLLSASVPFSFPSVLSAIGHSEPIKKKPRILHLLEDRNLGGVTRSLKLVLSSPLAEQFDFEICTPEEFLASREPAAAVIFHDAVSWKTLPLLWRLSQKTRLIIHEHHYSAGFEEHNVPCIARFHMMLKLAYSLAWRVVAVSHAQASWMLKHNLVHTDKLHAFQQCYPLSPLLAKPFSVPTGKLVLGAYGRFCHMKGFDTLISAMANLTNQPIHLLIGGYGSDEEKLRAQAKGMNNVEFVGLVKDVGGFLEQCDAIVIPSRWEPFGGVCLEARAAGRPVIVSQVDGLTEQVEGCGFFVPPDNVDALSKTIHKLQTQELRMLGTAARDSAHKSTNRYFANWGSLLIETAN